MRKLIGMLLLLLALIVGLLPYGAHASTVQARDWSDVVDFTGTNLNKYSAADAALLQMLNPERVKDPTMRAKLQRQLDSLKKAQLEVVADAKRAGLSPAQVDKKVLSVRAPYLASSTMTIDPGCQLTSSNPDGYDLCAYDSRGDTMTLFASGRKHVMWAGIQEIDAGSDWRYWNKSQAYGLSSDNVNHNIDVDAVHAWERNEPNGSDAIVGSADPNTAGPCAPCYWTGSNHDQFSGQSYGVVSQRDWMAISNTNDSTDSNNYNCSGWWYRTGGYSYWGDGPSAACI